MTEKFQDTFIGKLWIEAAKSWPNLPLLGFGFIMAWNLFASTGGPWLSDIEINGENLSVLYIISTVANALTFLIMSPNAMRKGQWASRTSVVLAAGGLGFLGSALIIFTGPYYLSQLLPPYSLWWFFCLGGVLAGVGNGIIGVRLALLYGSQPPRVALLYVGFSIFVTAFAYFAFQGSPSWALIKGGPTVVGIITFLLLPIAAAIVASVPSKVATKALGRVTSDKPAKPLPSAFYRFVAVGFILAVTTSMMRASVVHTRAPWEWLPDNNFLMLIRIAIAIVFVLSALCMAIKTINFGKVSIAVVVVIVLAMACNSAASDFWGPSSIVAYAAFFLFEVMFWCLLSFVVYQKGVSAVVVFGVGQGVFLLGCALGWVLGAYGFPMITGYALPSTIMAFLGVGVLVASILLFNDRVFEALFSPADEDEPSFDDMAATIADKETEGLADPGLKKSFKEVVAIISEEFGVSPREADVLRLLAYGRGSDFIASDLQLSRNTIRTHTHNIYLKLGVHSREELISFVESYR